MRIILTFFCLIIFLQVFGQVKKIKTSDYTEKQYYTDITFLSEGEFSPKIAANNVDRQTAFRVIITTSEIYNTLIFEKVSYGSEGGNKQILTKRKVDLEQIWTEFKLTREITSLEFIKWLTWDSFEIKILDSNYIFKDISSGTINVTKK